MSISPSQSSDSEKKISVDVSEQENSVKETPSEFDDVQGHLHDDDLNSIRSMTPLADRSISQISQVSANRSLTSRKSSPLPGTLQPPRQSSLKSAVSHVGSGAESGISFFSNSSTKRKIKGVEITQNSREITFTVSIAMAIPASNDDEEKKAKRIVTDPKAQSFYHIEYYLLPVDADPVKTDVTSFGIAAKLYPERQEARLLKTWTENNKTWIAWTHSHKVSVTTELLKKLCYHKIVLRVWDTRERFSVTAKNDRPKAFKLPHPKPGEDIDDLSGVKTIVGKHAKAYIKNLPKSTAPNRGLPATAEVEAAMAAKSAGLLSKKDTLHTMLTLTDQGHLFTPSGRRKLAAKSETGLFEHYHGYLEELRQIQSCGNVVYIPSDDQKTDQSTGSKKGQGQGAKRQKKAKSKSAVGVGGASDVPSLLVAHPDMEYKNLSRLMELAMMESPINNKPARATIAPVDQRPGSNSPLAQKPPTAAPSVHSTGDQGEAGRESSQSKGEEFTVAKTPRTPVPHIVPPETPGGQTLKSKSPGGTRNRPRDKKAEMMAKDNAEYAKKFGVCSIHLSLGSLFMGSKSVSARMETPVKSVYDAFVSVTVDQPLLTDEQKTDLNPISLQLLSVKNLPNTPLSFQELKLRCQQVTAKFQFLGHPEFEIKPKEHAKDIYWNEKSVMLLGTIPSSEVREYLLGPPMVVEVHDRDLKPAEAEKITPSLFGKEPGDEKISNVGVISGKRTAYNPLRQQPQQWNPYGVAKADLSDLLLGERILNLHIPLLNSPQPDILGRQDDKGRLVGMAAAVDGPTESHLRQGDYVEASSFVKMRVEVAKPLVTPECLKTKPARPQTKECPFNRIVYCFEYSQVEVVKDLINMIMDLNARALGLSSLVPMVLDAALSTYRLTQDQKTSGTLDIVTGFQVMDGIHHIFVLEGLKDSSMKKIWYTLPKPCLPEIQVLYNSDMAFAERLYGELDVDLTRVKLHEPLPDIVKQPLLYVRDVVPKPSFEALVKLNELIQCKTLRQVAKTSLFPSAAMVISMSREFGIPLVSDDLITDIEKQYVADAKGSSATKGMEARPDLYQQETSLAPSRERRKEPLNNYNYMYMEQLQSRERGEQISTRDHVSENIRSVDAQSYQVLLSREAAKKTTQASAYKQVHNYSTQTFNSTELAIENIRNGLDKETVYSYNPQFHHSHTFVPVNVKKIQNGEAKAHKAKFKTDKGWAYPGVRNLRQCNEHPKRPVDAKIQLLKEEWEENTLHTNKLNPTLNKETFPWTDRDRDLNLWTKAPDVLPPKPPHSITWTDDKFRRSLKKAATEQWYSKVVVDNPRFKLHRLNPQTELAECGPSASNELFKLEGMLKDEPMKFSYSAPGFKLAIPPLNVVHNPLVDKANTDALERHQQTVNKLLPDQPKAFKPGPLERSWTMENNRVPANDYQHADKGYFNVYHMPQLELYKRTIHPLQKEDYQTHLFQTTSSTAQYVPKTNTQTTIATTELSKAVA